MRNRLITSVIALAAATALAGCTASASLTVPAQSVADQAAGALEEQVGSLPEIDCGDEQVRLIDGTEVDCLLTDPSSGLEYDTVVTISNVDGINYSVDVQVADTPNNAGTPPEVAPGTEGSGPLVYSYELADAARDALEPEYGARPTIVCEDTGQIAITVGFTIECDLTEASSGAKGIATITVTSIEGLNYNIGVEVRDA